MESAESAAAVHRPPSAESCNLAGDPGDPLPHVPNFSGDSPAGRGEGLVETGWEGALPQLGPRRGPELRGGAGRVNRSPTSPLSPPGVC